MVKVILAEIYMLEHFLWSFFVTECHNYEQIAQGIQKFSQMWSSWLITKDIHVLHGFFKQSEWKWLKDPVRKRKQIYTAFDPYGVPCENLFSFIQRSSGGKIWPKRLAGTEKDRKRVKEWRKATFMKEKVKALDHTRILAPADLR